MSATRPASRSARPAQDRAAPTCSTPPCCSPTRGALRRFDEHEVVLPVVVITELEGKRHHPELGLLRPRGAADARRAAGRARPARRAVPVGDDGGTLRVELNHTDPTSLPAGFRLGDNDTRILAVALNLADEGRDVTLVSKDLPLRVKAAAVGLAAEEYRAELGVDSGWTGMAELDVAGAELDQLYDDGVVDLDGGRATCPCHTGAGAALRARQRAGPGRRRQAGAAGARRPRGVRPARPLAPSSGSRSTCCSTPRSASSRSAAAPAPASPRSRCAPASRRCSSAASTRRSWCSARCTRSAARSSATCPAARRRR